MAAEVHVFPDTTTGGWKIDARWFATLREAEMAALRQASTRDVRVFLHDRYHRVRQLLAQP
jgi:hypothetical protein